MNQKMKSIAAKIEAITGPKIAKKELEARGATVHEITFADGSVVKQVSETAYVEIEAVSTNDTVKSLIEEFNRESIRAFREECGLNEDGSCSAERAREIGWTGDDGDEWEGDAEARDKWSR